MIFILCHSLQKSLHYLERGILIKPDSIDCLILKSRDGFHKTSYDNLKIIFMEVLPLQESYPNIFKDGYSSEVTFT